MEGIEFNILRYLVEDYSTKAGRAQDNLSNYVDFADSLEKLYIKYFYNIFFKIYRKNPTYMLYYESMQVKMIININWAREESLCY